ncbi:MAG: MurR/RpiR family transcriptional regulator, partial [Pseudoflavonifractor sp.]
AEKKVADFVAGSPRDVLFMSITELADACGVGETSVFRFCRTVGLGGYQEFKMQLSLGMHDTEDDAGPLSGEILPEDDLSAVVQKVLQVNQRALAETATLLSVESLSQAVDYMSAARRIAFFGVGASLVAAQKAGNKFLRIEPKVITVSDAHAQAMVAATMTAEDVAVVISYSGSTKDTNAVAKLAKEAGAKVIAITRFHKSPLTEFTDVTLLCGAKESPLQGGSTSADISQAFVFDLMYTEYYRRNWEKCSENNRRTSASVLNKLY